MLVNKATKVELLEAVEIRRDKLKLSHLQYADDTIFVVTAKQSNAWAMKCILRNFELASGLKVTTTRAALWELMLVKRN